MNLYPVKNGGFYGYMNSHGNLVLDFDYHVADHFNEGAASVMFKDYSQGMIDTAGSILFKSDNVETLFELKCGYACVQNNDYKTGYINSTGELLNGEWFDRGTAFSEGIAIVANKRKYGGIDTLGNQVVDFKYDYISSYYGGLASFEKNDQWGVIDNAGIEICLTDFDRIWEYSDGLAVFSMNRKNGYIGQKGEVIIPPVYCDCRNFGEGVSGVKYKTGLFGFIDVNEKEIFSDRYDDVGVFKDGYACVANKIKNQSALKWGLIDRNAKVVVDTKYDFVERYCSGVIRVEIGEIETGGKLGYLNDSGEELWPLS